MLMVKMLYKIKLKNVLDKKMEQGSDMADENDTVAEVLVKSQDSQPLTAKLLIKRQYNHRWTY